MKVEEAILKLTTRPDLDQQVLDSPFFKFYRRIDMQTCNEIAALIKAQSKIVEAAREMVKCQNGGYLDFHTYYGKALKDAEKALAEFDGENEK
jgi:hypothetical protein